MSVGLFGEIIVFLEFGGVFDGPETCVMMMVASASNGFREKVQHEL